VEEVGGGHLNVLQYKLPGWGAPQAHLLEHLSGPEALDVAGDDTPMRAVFIRAPWVDEHGDGVDVLAEIDGHPVAVRQGNVLAVSFHPELAGDGRLHELLLDLVSQ